MSIRNWFSASDWSGGDTGFKNDIWTDPLNNGDKICACIILFSVFACFVFTILSVWFEWEI